MKSGLYAIIFEETKQVLFNVPKDYIKHHPRHVVQQSESTETLELLESKYKVKIEQRYLDKDPNYCGYFIAKDKDGVK